MTKNQVAGYLKFIDQNRTLFISIYMYILYMSIYRRLIVIGKYMEGKFIAGKSLHFIGCKSNQKNATIMTIQRHFGVMHVTKYVQNSILHQIKGLKLFKMVVNDLRKPDSVVVIQNYVKLFDRMGKIYGKTFIILLILYRR